MRRRSARCGVRDNEVNAMTDETMGTVLQNCPGVRCACRCRRYRVRGVRVQAAWPHPGFQAAEHAGPGKPRDGKPCAAFGGDSENREGPANWQLIPPGGRSSYRGPQSAVRHLPKRHDGFAHACDHRAHAGGFRISDADSFNGLWVNNLNVKDADLRDGDIVQIGTFCLMYLATPTMR